ncbi:MAG: NAD(P)H-hydrate epimerase [Candidatus Omnitrophota bacterium]|mgnify:CR=1 FL=1|nr:MAG: NAD(P)H-hydrate epimerase [Candidatus Omnitrophota bacterium]
MVRNSKVITSQKAKEIDIKAQQAFGISGLLLMENAARQIAEEAVKMLAKDKKVAIFCGKGNNAGDGFAAARHLLVKGIKPLIFLAGKKQEVKNEAKVNLDILLKLKQKIIEVKEGDWKKVKNIILKYPLIIDALLGIGLSGEVRGLFREIIPMVNSLKVPVLSVDIPSGLDANNGKVLGCCVRADKTVTFVAIKRGMTVANGPKYCGKVVVKDLGIPL